MDHTAAAGRFDRLAGNLAAASAHLVGPGLVFTRHHLDAAAADAAALADIHRAAVEQVAHDYVRDLLGTDALDRPA